jgi:VIT1/CCC1 family predicted Fe2+/Mn2+ transporter
MIASVALTGTVGTATMLAGTATGPSSSESPYVINVPAIVDITSVPDGRRFGQRQARFHDLLGPAADCGQDRHMQHVEKHFTGGETVRDVVIGMADGLTVPFALAAGISGAIASTHIVVTAGLAEVAAGSIAMGLGGFLAAKGDAEHYESELRREENEICEVPEREAEEIVDLFKDYGVTASEAAPVVAALRREPKAWRDFMMRFELGLEAPDPKRALRSALTIAGSYVIGGMIPLLPYMLAANAHQALMVSIAVTLLALALFGFVKGHFTGVSKFKSAWQTAFVGSLAAGVAFAIAKAIS